MSSKVVSESRAGAAALILNAAEMFCCFSNEHVDIVLTDIYIRPRSRYVMKLPFHRI